MQTTLSVTRAGSGEPLLLLHGLGSSRRDFTAVLPALTDSFDVINVDLPGIGRSPHLEQRPTVTTITDAVENTLDTEGVGRVHVLGNSLGARVAWSSPSEVGPCRWSRSRRPDLMCRRSGFSRAPAWGCLGSS